MKEIPIKDEYIKLDQFLKFVNLVSSGIEAKMIIKLNLKEIFIV